VLFSLRMADGQSRLKMRKGLFAATLLTAAVQLALPAAASADGVPSSAEQASCDRQPLDGIPARRSGAMTGSEFAERVSSLTGPSRDAVVESELLAGNIPLFLRRLVGVTLTDATGPTPVQVTVCVLPDYLAIGSDRDFIFVPMGLAAAWTVARQYGFLLPTPKLVDTIYQQSANKLAPQPLPASDAMRSTAYIVEHNELIRTQREARGAALGELTAGHKKDLVMTEKLWTVPGRVAIYGWHRGAQQPIQPLSTVHGARYADYSHGIRLVSDVMYVNHVKRSLDDALSDPALARLLTYEGLLPHVALRLQGLVSSLQ